MQITVYNDFPAHYWSLPINKAAHIEPFWATLKAGMMERRNGGITERRKMTPNPKRLNRGMAERRKITPNPKRRNRGTAEWRKMPRHPKRRNDGKCPEILKDGMHTFHMNYDCIICTKLLIFRKYKSTKININEDNKFLIATILGGFPSFCLLGFWGIFRYSVF